MNKLYILPMLVLLICQTACSDWFDVSPNTEVKTEKLFNSEDGFKSALTGIYSRMTNDGLYGRQLSFLFIENMAQRYDNNSSATDEQRRKMYDYVNDKTTKNNLAEIWSEMYQSIANINNLLKYLELKGDNIKTPGYRDLITGEAYALRAFHYFDLLRMWGPIYSQDSLLKALPWRSEFTIDKTPFIASNEMINNILHDLATAEELLKSETVSYEKLATEPFISYRQHRLNKYAVKALQARVLLWRGDKKGAGQKALEVINTCGLKLVRDNQDDHAFFNETLFGLNMFNMTERVHTYWTTGAAQLGEELWITNENTENVFEMRTIGINDIRYKSGYGFVHSGSRMMCRKYLENSSSNYNEKIPLIRLSEMYLIVAECRAELDGADYLNVLRNTRGISRNNNVAYTDTQSWSNLIEKEYSKEFFAEGQYFYFLKRLARRTFYRCPFYDGMKQEYYVFRTPDDEIEFGLEDGD